NQPLRQRGFVLSGHDAPSMTLLREGFGAYELDAVINFTGTIRILLAHDGPLGPEGPNSDAKLHPLSISRCTALEIKADVWRIIQIDERAEIHALAEGKRTASSHAEIRTERGMKIILDGNPIWSGTVPQGQ